MTKAAAQHGSGPAPRVNLEKAQQEAGMMAVDIGLLQGTVVRASLSKLPAFYRPEFWGYLWTLTKSKVVAWYT
jgi:protein MBA1